MGTNYYIPQSLRRKFYKNQNGIKNKTRVYNSTEQFFVFTLKSKDVFDHSLKKELS